MVLIFENIIMSFYLYLMRHAKSDWSGPGTADYDRPINHRGQKSAKRIGVWMADNNFLPEKIVSSPAVRARQTIEIVSEQLGHSQVKVELDKDLYLASMDALIESVQLYKNDVNSLMLVAHNPGLDYLVNDLLSRTINKNSGNIVMTTANLAIFEYKDSHFDPEKDNGTLVEFIQPKRLA
ncbi:MAG: phosphohistidine phosphatase [Gammaproteobacteria bacterium]